MSKSWSSFEGHQLLQENWRNFLSEETSLSASEKFFSDPELADQFDNEALSSYPDLGRGLTSDMEGSNSLKLVLQQYASFLRTPQRQAIINVMSQIADDEGIMLELSLKGLNSEQDRIIDSAGTAELLTTISSFGLSANQNKALIKALNYWGRTNSIKFTAPAAPAPSVVDDIEDLPPADWEEDEELPPADWEEDEELPPLSYPEEPSGSSPEAEIPQNPDPPMDTLPVTRDRPKDRAVNIQQIKGPGATEPEPEETRPELQLEPLELSSSDEPEEKTFDDTFGINDGEPFKPTPEMALKTMIKFFVPDSSAGPKAIANALKVAEYISKKGGGLVFQDARTDKYTNVPKWDIQDDGAGHLPYYGAYVAPEGIMNRLTSLARDPLKFDRAETIFRKKVNNQAKINLRNYIDLLEKEQEAREDIPDDPDETELQESFNRMKTLAGINQRVL
jgi:hypothetical protein